MMGHGTAVSEWIASDRAMVRRIGLAHLAAAAVVHLVAGVALIYLGATDGLIPWAFDTLRGFVTGVELLRIAETVSFVVTTGAVVAGAVSVLIGIGCLLATRSTAREPRGRWWLPAGVASALNPLALPLAVVGIVLLSMERLAREG